MQYICLTEIEWPATLHKLPTEIQFFSVPISKDISIALFEIYGVKPISYKTKIIKDADKVAISLLLPGIC